MDVRPFAKILNEKFQGRGGGKPEMVQGSVTGTEAEIRMITESTFG
jgi:alanyl-tRNA synthetase